MSGTFACIKDRADVRMFQRCRKPGLPQKARFRQGIFGGRRLKQLQRNSSVEPGIPGAVDLAHSAFTDERQNLVMVNRRANSSHGSLGREYVGRKVQGRTVEKVCVAVAPA
jgi:hypothetical protein